jgi:hypothetical protein
MKSGFIVSLLTGIIILLSIFVLVASKNNSRLKMEKETLILRSDSLHILQIQTNKELVRTQKKLDSLFGQKIKKMNYD